MVTEVKAFKATDGSLHPDELTALEYDTRRRLMGSIGQTPTVEVMGKLLAVFSIIQPLVQFIQAQPNGEDRPNA